MGAFLMVVGGVLFAGSLGFGLGVSAWNLWPFLLVGLGLVRLVWGAREEREGGFWILLAGLYGWVCVFGFAGLSWDSAWPIFLVGAGLWMALESLLRGRGRPAPGKEASDVS